MALDVNMAGLNRLEFVNLLACNFELWAMTQTTVNTVPPLVNPPKALIL